MLSSFSTWPWLLCNMWESLFPNQGPNLCLYFPRQILNHWTTREVLSFCLSTCLLLCTWMIHSLYRIFAFTNEIFPFAFFTVLVVALSFSLRGVPLTFLIKLVWLCWTLLAFAYLSNFHQIWMKALQGRVFLVVGFPTPPFTTLYHATPFWSIEFPDQLVSYRSSFDCNWLFLPFYF